jgi:hypothetical protein
MALLCRSQRHRDAEAPQCGTSELPPKNLILMLINIRVSELISDTSNSIPLAILAILAFLTPFSDIMPKVSPNVNEFNLSSLSDSVFLVSSNN